MTASLEVDLDAFGANLSRIQSVADSATVMLVVKDDAYGHGLAPIVRRAWTEGIRWIGAFDVRTGLAIRALLGADARIFIWISASPADALAAVAADLDIGVGDAQVLEEVAAAAATLDARARVHLKIDTGLHRNGVRPESWPAFTARARILEERGSLDVVGIWSHIAEASDEEDDAAREVFDQAIAVARRTGLEPRVRHLAASAASFARPEFRYDLVRVGAFAYGIAPAGGPSADELGIRPIATLRADVTTVHGELVHIGIGSLNGVPSTLAGRVDVATPEGARRVVAIHELHSVIEGWPSAGVGDTVAVYGPADTAPYSATALAETIGTIGEQIAVRLSPGIARVYRGR
ncbi:alanine racemase [Microbacterium rhizomatis]|uniref:Alanine racemase n=1 Tax=Microbacterium rhizomatis TaxID=1631477 RepID=A0A5J5J5V7_9MICO|nr:alanine racemase [Microbacterium rhizomatis]KAA9110514.1 alanine racemase [Microbacterium rhizomatis]